VSFFSGSAAGIEDSFRISGEKSII